MTAGSKSSQNFKLSDVVGETTAGIFASKGYIIKSGFLNSAQGEVLAFSVSPAKIDFGELQPETFFERKIKITIKNGNLLGYEVRVSENQPLSTLAQAEIPDTLCDKNSLCTPYQAGRWTDRKTYGFGYRVNGRTAPEDFLPDDFFRPFPATRRNESPVIILRSKAKKVSDQAEMILKLNISPLQPVGQYRNVLSFTALAGI